MRRIIEKWQNDSASVGSNVVLSSIECPIADHLLLILTDTYTVQYLLVRDTKDSSYVLYSTIQLRTAQDPSINVTRAQNLSKKHSFGRDGSTVWPHQDINIVLCPLYMSFLLWTKQCKKAEWPRLKRVASLYCVARQGRELWEGPADASFILQAIDTMKHIVLKMGSNVASRLAMAA